MYARPLSCIFAPQTPGAPDSDEEEDFFDDSTDDEFEVVLDTDEFEASAE